MCLSTKSSLCKFLPEKHGKTVTYYMGLYELITVVQLKHALSISERKKQSKMFFAFFSSLFASFHQYHFLAIFDCFFFIPVQVLYGQLLACRIIGPRGPELSTVELSTVEFSTELWNIRQQIGKSKKICVGPDWYLQINEPRFWKC